MDFRALRCFLAVAERGSYTRGAEALRVSQPAVSRQIRKLEHGLGRPLFTRHGHRVALTEAGRRLLERGQELMRGLEAAEAEIRAGEGALAGTVSLALPPAAGQMLLPALLERLARRAPRLSLRLIGGFSGTILEWLLRGQVDLACAHDPLPQRGLRILPLVSEPVYLVGRADRLPFRRDHARTEDLAALPLILPARPNASRRLLDGWTARRRLLPNVRMEVDDHAMIRALLRRGFGFSLLTQGAIAEDVRRGDLVALPIRPRAAWAFSLIVPEGAARRELVAPVVAAITEGARALVESGEWPGRWIGEGATQR